MTRFLKVFKTLNFALLASVFVLLSSVAHAKRNEILCEVRLYGATSAERNAGVWIDGEYLGYLNELKGSKKVLLIPGEHVMTFRETGYKDFTTPLVLGPGQKESLLITMTPDTEAQSPTEVAEVKLDVWPKRAAVFVDDHFAGHVSEFDGIGKAMLVSPGKHQFKITLPGWDAFETDVTLRPYQKFVLKTDLVPLDIRESDPKMKEEAPLAKESTAQPSGGKL